MNLKAKGFRELDFKEEIKRNKIIEIIENNFRKYGYSPIRHPAVEKLSVLEAKSGEGIKTEIFRFDDGELGLRYDLTVAAARMIAEHPEWPLPIKRYSIGKVWRREEPQHGRYREFLQADIDIYGAKKVYAEAELISCARDILKELKINNYEILVNNRKLINGVLKRSKVPPEKHETAIRIMDKLDKKGYDEVKGELEDNGVNGELLDEFDKKLDEFLEYEETKEGASELKELFNLLDSMEIKNYRFDPYLARGLGYYTGTIYEFKSIDKSLGTITAGGRYDDLVEVYSNRKVEAVGISFGVDRLITLVKELETKSNYTDIMLITVNTELIETAMRYAKVLRDKGYHVQTDITGRGFRKQIEYANNMGVKFVGIIGPKEAQEEKITIKNMDNGEQKTISVDKVTLEV